MTTVTNTGTPMGGTELILNRVRAALPELAAQVQLIPSRPQQFEPFEDKPRVLWLQDLPNDPASAVLRDPSYRSKFNRIVFVSFWQQQQYNLVLGIPFNEGVVIKNAVPHMAPTWPKPKPNGKLQFVYTSTPHRGLPILAAAADALVKIRQDWELHVYSSFNIYGWHKQDEDWKPLYDGLRNNPCVVYHGTQPNEVVRQAVLDAHVHVYPSTYVETSCMAIQEALMAGCLCITTSLGALIETANDWAWMIPFRENGEYLATYTLDMMQRALDYYDTDQVQQMLGLQSQIYQHNYAFEARVSSWKHLLEAVIAEGPPVEKLVIG